MNMNKRGISPVVATVLLITISIILIAIIFIWAKGTVTDVQVKFGEDINNVCNDISLDISVVGTTIDVVNNGGRVSVWGVALRTLDGDLEECIFNEVLTPGKAVSVNALTCTPDGDADDTNIEAIIPILETDETEYYNCEKNEINYF